MNANSFTKIDQLEKIPPAFCTQRLKKLWVLIIAAEKKLFHVIKS